VSPADFLVLVRTAISLRCPEVRSDLRRVVRAMLRCSRKWSRKVTGIDPCSHIESSRRLRESGLGGISWVRRAEDVIVETVSSNCQDSPAGVRAGHRQAGARSPSHRLRADPSGPGGMRAGRPDPDDHAIRAGILSTLMIACPGRPAVSICRRDDDLCGYWGNPVLYRAVLRGLASV